MKELKSYFESLLNKTSVKVKNIDVIPDIIEQFLKENYKIYGTYTINKTKSRYIVDVKGNVDIKNINTTSLTNEFFEFGSISGSFNCEECESLKSLKGAPKEVGGDFDCGKCISLKSLEGCPEKVGCDFVCNGCTSLKSLEYSPKEVDGGFYCIDCNSLKSLEGAPKEVGGNFLCGGCGVKFKIEDIKRYTNVNVHNIYT